MMESQDITIKKAKVSKGGCVEASYIDVDGNEITMKGRNKCHNDLRVSIAALVPFFTDLTEQKEADSIDWANLESESNAELLRKLDVTGVSIGGDANNRIITMTGRRVLVTSRVLNLNAPGVEMDSESFEWDHIDEFDLAVQDFVCEVKEYIINKKWEVVQQEIEFSGDLDDPFADAQPTDEGVPIEIPAESVA